MKHSTLFAVFIFAGLLFEPCFARPDSLSCKSALDRILKQIYDMQVCNEYDSETYLNKLPLYTQKFNAFLDSVNVYNLWQFIPDPWELKIEKVRLDFYADPTLEKKTVKSSLEKIIDQLKTNSLAFKYKSEFAEVCNYLSMIYFQNGEITKEIEVCNDAITLFQDTRKEGEVPSLLEWMLRTRMANALLKSQPLKALASIEMVKLVDIRGYDNYTVNKYRKMRLENTLASALETLGNIYTSIGNIQDAIDAYASAIKFTDPKRPTWDSVILSLTRLYCQEGDGPSVERIIQRVKKEKPAMLLSVYLIAADGFFNKKDLKTASEYYRQAFDLLTDASAEEQIEVLISLIQIYTEMGSQDQIFEILRNIIKNEKILKNDELSYLFSKACFDIGIQIKQNNGSYKEYFGTAEKILSRKASTNLNFLSNPYAGKFLFLLSQLYLHKLEKNDIDKAEDCLKKIISGNRSAAHQLKLEGDYASDVVVSSKLLMGHIYEIRKKRSPAVQSYKELVSDYSAEWIYGTLKFHNSKEVIDSSAASLFRISDNDLKNQSFAESLKLCEWLSQQENCPAEIIEKAEFLTLRTYYYWGFTDKTKFQQALVIFNRINPKNNYYSEAEFLTTLCKWNLGFGEAAVDDLLALYGKLQKNPNLDQLLAFLNKENIFGYTRTIAESIFLQGNSEKSIPVLEMVLETISKNRIDTPEEAKAIYALAKIIMINGLPKEQKLRKVESLLDRFFQNKYATNDMWIYFRAGELKMDLDFDLGRLSAITLQKQIDQLQNFNNSKEELQKIIDSRNFYKGPGLISLENLDLIGLKEKVMELQAKCYYMLGRVYGKDHRWKEALEAYDIVLDQFLKFDLYASRALYHKGLIYLTYLDRIEKAVDIFIQLFKQYDDTQLAIQVTDDLRESARIAKQPREISAWFSACRKMLKISSVSKEKNLSKFAIQLVFYIADKHIGHDEVFTNDRAVMSSVVNGINWLANNKDTTLIASDDAARANLLLARAYRLESDMRPGSICQKFGITYPEKNREKENTCYRRIMKITKNPIYYEEARWRLTVNLALMGESDESKKVAWNSLVFSTENMNLREKYQKEIGVLIAYMAPAKIKPFNRDVQIAVENIIDETQKNGLADYAEKIFYRTREQVKVLRMKTSRYDMKPEVLDLKNYPNGKWSGEKL